MSLAAVRRAEAAVLLHTYDRLPVLFRRGRGVYLYDENGRAYLDFLTGIGVNALGHGHPAIRRTLVAQGRRLLHVSNLFYHDYQAALARKLTRISGLDRVFFTNSGTEAIEGALKLARAYARLNNPNGRKPRWRLLALDNSFHGRTFGALAATGQAKYRAPFLPLMPGVRFVRFNDVRDLEKQFDSSVCAVLLEPIQGEGGIQPLRPAFLERARALTRRHDALLIADEIQCGLGRTGRWFAFQAYGVQPDIVTVAKPLAAGLPLGAILASERVARAFHPGMHGTTFGGGPLACAVGLAFLETIERERLLVNVRRMGNYFRSRLGELQHRYDFIRTVRGMGLMLAMDLAFPGNDVVKQALSRGVVINCTHNTVLRFLPPYILDRHHVDKVISVLNSIFAQMQAEKRSAATQ
ncbi:MAG TPA: aspartate aminotransferase family protein [Candidatus Xenobia bacterium]|nr:aspartate aminotransferase family protein [Candidatus Xenobia bacterium]